MANSERRHEQNKIGAGAVCSSLCEAIGGTGLVWGALVSDVDSVKAATKRGASWLVASHAPKLSAGAPASVIGLMPYADANAYILEIGPELAAAAGDVPLFAGVLAADQFRQMGNLLVKLRRLGYAGVQNFPSVGIASGRFRHLLESADIGYETEKQLMRLAVDVGLFATAVVFTAAQAREMAEAGAGMLLAHPGLTPDGEQKGWSSANFPFLRQVSEQANRPGSKVATAAYALGAPSREAQEFFIGCFGVQYEGGFGEERSQSL